METVRFAAAQFETGTDIAENLVTCCRMIDTAAHYRPQVLVLPEFCNHLSWYENRQHSYEVAVDLEGDFLATIAQKARQHAFYVMINCTVRRGPDNVTGTNILFAPDGTRVATSDKQVLMGNENNFLTKADACSPIIQLPFARLGMYSCMDGVIYETPRALALRGAQVLLNSLNSFALDEASLHVPVRAAENKVFVVAANKTGWLVPPELAPVIAERVKIAPEQLRGGGESQIVAPDGRVLAKAPHDGDAVICADVVPSQADDKYRPDGTHIFEARRPRLYAPIASAHTATPPPAEQACLVEAWQSPDEAALVDHLAKTEAQLLVMPELWGIDTSAPLPHQVEQGEKLTQRLQTALAGRDTHVAISVVTAHSRGFAHTSLLINADDVPLRQHTLHFCNRHPWATVLADHIHTHEMPWGRIALIGGGDTIYPELFRLVAIQGAHAVACPSRIMEAWEMETGLLERAAENRLNLCVASSPSSAGTSAILAVGHDFTLWTAWHTRPFDGNISYPIVTRAQATDRFVRGTIYPDASRNRMVSQKTDLVANRPHWLLEALVE